MIQNHKHLPHAAKTHCACKIIQFKISLFKVFFLDIWRKKSTLVAEFLLSCTLESQWFEQFLLSCTPIVKNATSKVDTGEPDREAWKQCTSFLKRKMWKNIGVAMNIGIARIKFYLLKRKCTTLRPCQVQLHLVEVSEMTLFTFHFIFPLFFFPIFPFYHITYRALAKACHHCREITYRIAETICDTCTIHVARFAGNKRLLMTTYLTTGIVYISHY